MKISFTGTHCSGKTTLLNKCKTFYGDRFQYVDEITRDALKLGLQINESGDDETQLFIVESHLKNSQLDNVILDRCIVDGLVYTFSLFNTGLIHETVMNRCEDVYREIVSDLDIIFFTEPIEGEIIADGTRSDSKAWQMDIHEMFNRTLYQLTDDDSLGFKGKVISLIGSADERFELIKETLEYEEN